MQATPEISVARQESHMKRGILMQTRCLCEMSMLTLLKSSSFGKKNDRFNQISLNSENKALKRILDVVNHRVFANMTPGRRAQKLAIVSSLAKVDKEVSKSTPVNGVKALSFKRDGNTIGVGEEVDEVAMTRQTRSVITVKAEDQQPCKEEVRRVNSVPVEVHASQDQSETSLGGDLSTNLLAMPSISATNLLEEIEADLPSPYSLASVLDHTLHTVTNLRTWARLSRVGTNCVQVGETVKNKQNPESDQVNKIKKLQKEAFIQKTLIEQADKAVRLCKVRKKTLDVEDLESVRVLLMAKLKYEAINLEIQTLTYSGEDLKEDTSGEMDISDVWFTVSDSKISENDHFVCVAYHRDNLFASHVQGEVVNGKLHFPVNFKFKDMRQTFIVHLELYRLSSGAKLKKERKKVLDVKNLMKLSPRLSKGNAVKGEQKDFECVGTGALRLGDIKCRKKGKVSVDFHFGYYSPFADAALLKLQTRINVNASIHGFLDLFKDTCWHRLWCCLTGSALQFWRYPEDKDDGKTPVESVLLRHCHENVQPVSMDVCIRPHSFMISYNKTEKGVLLSASSRKDMMTWIGNLRSTIRCFEVWAPDF